MLRWLPVLAVKPDGFKLYAIRPNSLYAKLGLQNKDTLQSINGLADHRRRRPRGLHEGA